MPRLTPAERAAQRRAAKALRDRRLRQVIWWLACGCQMTEEQIAARFDISEESIGALLDTASEDVPIYNDEQGRWRKR